MNTIYFTLTGTSHHYGLDYLEPGFPLILQKDPGNEYDHEAIKVRADGLGTIGYVANSVRTVIVESFSAGRLYDKIGNEAVAHVHLVLPYGALCVLDSIPCTYDHYPEIEEETEELAF